MLPGTAAGSLAGALGGLTEGEVGGTPGVNTVLGGGVATALLAGYVLVFILVSGWLTARRDLAGDPPPASAAARCPTGAPRQPA